MSDFIYFDNAATTKVRDEVFEAMAPFLKDAYGNPSSVYKLGREAKNAIEKAREQTAAAIGAKPAEIFFTGSGTESDNWAIISAAFANKDKGNHIITSNIEHHAVLHSCEYLSKNGFDITYLPVDSSGIIKISDLKAAIRPETILISIMYANNEIGTIQPIAEIGAIAGANNILFHTDAVQAVGHVPVNVVKDCVDLLTLSAHKFHGPKGAGALYVRSGVKLPSFIHGGGQEKGRRAGTENVAGIVGLGCAIELITREMAGESVRVRKLRDKIIDGILESVPNSQLNGHRDKRLPGNANISFDYVEGESILLMLDMKGIAASSGSACTSGSLNPSHVLMALGLPHEKAHGSLRVSAGRYNTDEDADKLIAEIGPIVNKLRAMSPLAK
ncbi:MAG: cysteine desulfurase NifS [Defluviitaleaceae bacterium]|nr:cysteine desulfurase NifS [Defluviitaleaceae bacterium]